LFPDRTARMIECSFSSIQYFRQGFGSAVSKFLEDFWRDSGIR
jgi:hypothetical protein